MLSGFCLPLTSVTKTQLGFDTHGTLERLPSALDIGQDSLAWDIGSALLGRIERTCRDPRRPEPLLQRWLEKVRLER